MSDLKYPVTYPPYSDRAAEPVGWLPETEEADILERVEGDLVQAFRQQHGEESAPAGIFSQLGRWLLAGSTVCAAAACAFFLWPTSSLAPLQIDGVALQGKATSQSRLSTLQLRIEAGKTGRIAEARRWRMKIGSTTRLALTRSGTHTRTVKLERGFVKVHVTPGQVQQFSVRSQGYQVLVKGTVFSVEREGSWLRVEVQRGKVVLQAPDRSQQPIAKGQGLRVSLPDGALKRYSLPTSAPAKKRHSRLRWMLERDANNAFQYGLDLASSRRIARKRRVAKLRWLSEKLLVRRQYAQHVQLLQRLSELQSGSTARVEAGNAVGACLIYKLSPSLCKPIYRKYLLRFPKGERASTARKGLQKAGP